MFNKTRSDKEFEQNLRYLDAVEYTLSKKTRVLITVPVYNEEALIDSFLDSLIKQVDNDGNDMAYDLFHIIIIDNFSTDNTSRIVRKYIQDHPDLSIELISEKRKGVRFARKTGLDLGYYRYIQNRKILSNRLAISSIDADNMVSSNWLSALISKLDDDNAEIFIGSMIFDILDFQDKDNYLKIFNCVGKFGDKIASCFGPKTSSNYALTPKAYLKIGGQRLHPVGEETGLGILAYGKGLKSVYHEGMISFNFRRFQIERAHYFDMFLPRRGRMTDVRIVDEISFTDLTQEEIKHLANGPLKEYQIEYCILRPLIMNPLLFFTMPDLLSSTYLSELFYKQLLHSHKEYFDSGESFDVLMRKAYELSINYNKIFYNYLFLP